LPGKLLTGNYELCYRAGSRSAALTVPMEKRDRAVADHLEWRLLETKERENMKPTSDPNGEAASANITKRIQELGDWRGETLAHVRQLIHDADPDIQEEWKWEKPKSPGTPVWSHDGIVCTGESYKQVVKLTFARGASIEDPKKLFNSSLEGNTRRAIDLREGEKINEAAFKQLIRAAVAANSAARAQREAKKK
jgi:hypothetical protein